MKTFTKSISLTLVFAMLIAAFSAFGLQASAATIYDCMKTKTLTVKTNSVGWYEANPYITFECRSDSLPAIPHDAPLMTLKIEDKTHGTTSWARISGTGKYISSKLKLQGGRTYKITVSYLYNAKENKEKLAAGTGLTWNTGKWGIKNTSKLSYTIK